MASSTRPAAPARAPRTGGGAGSHALQPASPALVWLALGAVYLIWGSTYLAIRVAVRTLPPLLMASTRFLVAGAVLYTVAIRRGDRTGDRPTWRQWRAAGIVGGLLLLGGNGLVVLAERRVESGIAALFIALVPLWMVVIGWAAFRERVTWREIAGLVLGFGGLLLLVGLPGGRVDGWGAAMLVGASLSWASGSMYSRKANLPSRPLLSTAMEMVMGGALLLVVGLASGELGQVHLGSVSSGSVAGLLYLIVFGSWIAFSAYVWLLRVARTSLVGTYAFVNPVVAVLLGWAILGEAITLRTLAAGAVIVVSVAIIITARSKRRAAPSSKQAATVAGGAEANS